MKKIDQTPPQKKEEEKAEFDKVSEDTKSSNYDENVDKENNSLKLSTPEVKKVELQPILKLGNAFCPTFFKKPI